MLSVEQEIEAWRTAEPVDAPFGTCPCCQRSAPPPGGMTPIFGVMSALDANCGDATEREIGIDLDGYGFNTAELSDAMDALVAAGLITSWDAPSPDACPCSLEDCTGCRCLSIVFEPVPTA